MSKRGPLDAYFSRLPATDAKKAKTDGVSVDSSFQGKPGLEVRTQQDDIKTKQAAGSDQQPAQQPAQQSGQPSTAQPSTDPLVQADTPAVQPLQTAGTFRPGPKGAAQAFAARSAGQAAAAATGGAAGSNAFGALMSAAKNKKAPSSASTKLSSQEMRQQADKNQAAAAAAVQAAMQAQQQPQLKSLLVEPSWLEVLGPEFNKPYMQQLQGFLEQEWSSQTIYPPKDSIFRAFNAVPFDQVRVVILGQDPYINQGEAMGLSFSVPPGIRVPPSLANIYKELAQDVGAAVPKHGCLQKWCSQGVLLLNAALTVRAKNSNSHAGKGWESFTSAALTALAKQRSGIVFLLWGKYAQDRCAKLDMKKHFVLKSVHPSPLSAHRGFLGCRHFSAANKLLEQSGQPPIDWHIDDV